MRNGGDKQREVARRLQLAGCLGAEEEAEELLAAAPGPAALAGWVRRREAGEPLAWITGSLRFCGHRVAVAPGLYVPRPQSEGLARRAAALLAVGGRLAVDLCTGTGAVAVHLLAEVPGARVLGMDRDHAAVACARRNGVPAVQGDLGAALPGGRFDLVTAVAPYVPTRELAFLPRDVLAYEPRPALDGGPDGLAVVRRVVAAAGRLLRAGGWLLVELGGEQDRALAPALAAAGFGPFDRWEDEEGDLRGLVARWAGPRPTGS